MAVVVGIGFGVVCVLTGLFAPRILARDLGLPIFGALSGPLAAMYGGRCIHPIARTPREASDAVRAHALVAVLHLIWLQGLAMACGAVLAAIAATNPSSLWIEDHVTFGVIATAATALGFAIVDGGITRSWRTAFEIFGLGLVACIPGFIWRSEQMFLAPIGLLHIGLAIALGRAGYRGLAARTSRLSRCVCGYDLRGLRSAVCPECGAKRSVAFAGRRSGA